MHEQDFLDAILNDPADGPRLKYADWLEARNARPSDRAHAEFIRIGLRSASLAADDPETIGLTARSLELLKEFRAEWASSVAPYAVQSSFHRGMVEAVAVEAAALPGYAANIFRAAPVKSLTLVAEDPIPSGWGSAVAALPELQRLATLDLSQLGLSPNELADLLHSPHLAALCCLRFNESNCDVQTTEVLADCAHLTEIRTLEFFGFHEGFVGDEGCAVLSAASHLRNLERLDLRDNSVGPAGIAALANSPHIRGLRSLYLGDGHYTPNAIGSEGLAALAGSPNFAPIEELRLDFNEISAAGAFALAESRSIRNLRVLTLVGNPLSVESLEVLARSSVLRSIEELDLPPLKAGGDQLALALTQSPFITRPRRLSLMGLELTSAGLARLAQAPWLPQLRELRLSNNPLGDDGIKLLCSSDAFQKLPRLRLDAYSFGRAEPALRVAFGDRLVLEKLVMPSMYAGF